MRKLLFAAVTALSACVASASAMYDASSGSVTITGSMVTPVSNTPASVTGTGASWSLNVADGGGWSEGYAYVTFQVEPNTRVQIVKGTLQNTITDGGQGWYWGDVVLFASAVNPNSAIAGQVAGPTVPAGVPAPGVMAWVDYNTYDTQGYKNWTKADLTALGYRYMGESGDGYSSYLGAILGYSANVENFRDGGLDIVGGAFAGWNEGSATSMASGTSARSLTDILYPAGGGLNRPLQDQTYAFDGTVLTGTTRTYVTLIVRGGGGGFGSINVNNLTLAFSSPDYLPITGAMMTPVLSTGSSIAVNGTGTDWSLDVAGSGEAEGYAYTTFMVPPNTRVQLTSGTIQNTFSGSWYFGDVVLFASSVNPNSAIAGQVAGPTTPGSNADPAPGVMAYLTYQQFKDNGYKLLYRSKETVNNAGYRYMDNAGNCASYLAAIGQYSSNVENFQDGGLDINGGAYVGWNQLSAPKMTNGAPACALTDILYPAWGGLNRPLKDQTFDFDGTVYSGSNNTYITVMVRGGGGANSGSVLVKNLGLSLSTNNTLKLVGPMMIPVSSGTPTTVTGYDAAWSLNVEDQGWSEGYAYTTFMVAPNTKVQLTGGTMQNTIRLGSANYYFGDLVIFASAVNPSSAIAGKVAGPTGSNPAPGVMAWVDGSTYDANGYGTMTKEALVNLGYRYNGGWSSGFNSYLDAIGGYSCNVENFRDGGLTINGGAYVGWNDVSATMFAPDALTPSAIRPLTEIQFAAGGWLNRPLTDQTYAFDGSVYTGNGPANMYVTIMVRGGGGTGGSINVNDLAVTFSNADTLPLTIEHLSGQVKLSWPGDAYGMVVEETDSLQGEDTVWTAITDSPTLVSGKWTLQKATGNDKHFYRLRVK